MKQNNIRVWRSLVSRLNGVQEAAGSNPVTRTKQKEEAKGLPLFCYLFLLSRMFLEAQRFIAGIERTQTRTVRISAAGWEA